MKRSEVIRWLGIMRENLIHFPEISNQQKIDSLDYAISSLKADEAYQIMYEGGEIFTKADMVAMLEDLDLQIDELAAYNLEVAKVQRLIRNKISSLKEN